MRDAISGPDSGGKTGSDAVAAVAFDAAPVATVPLAARHDVAMFKCEKSSRVESFFVSEWPALNARNYCKTFVLECRDDPSKIVGYYTLSSAIMLKKHYTNGDERRSPLGFNPPMVRIGFMGKCDGSPKGVGKILIADAANRVSRITDIGICGLLLEPEGGLETKLAKYYESLGFKKCREAHSMYAFLKDLIV